MGCEQRAALREATSKGPLVRDRAPGKTSGNERERQTSPHRLKLWEATSGKPVTKRERSSGNEAGEFALSLGPGVPARSRSFPLVLAR